MKIELDTAFIGLNYLATYGAKLDPEDMFHVEQLEEEIDWQRFSKDKYLGGIVVLLGKELPKAIEEALDIFQVKNIKIIHYSSPRCYNFLNDTFMMEMEVPDNLGVLISDYARNNISDEKLITFLSDNFSSYDGFHSFLPNTIPKLMNSALGDGFEEDEVENELFRACGAVFAYLFETQDFESEVDSILERISSNISIDNFLNPIPEVANEQ